MSKAKTAESYKDFAVFLFCNIDKNMELCFYESSFILVCLIFKSLSLCQKNFKFIFVTLRLY